VSHNLTSPDVYLEKKPFIHPTTFEKGSLQQKAGRNKKYLKTPHHFQFLD